MVTQVIDQQHLTWRGTPVSDLTSMWIDQIVSLQELSDTAHADGCYIDVLLTATNHGGSANSPEITFKPRVERPTRRSRY